MTNHNTQRTYYEILEVAENAQDHDLKNAYRRLVSYWHPDTGHHERYRSEQELKLINEAYTNLKNKNFRDKYNQIIALQKKALAKKNDTPKAWRQFWHWLIMNEGK